MNTQIKYIREQKQVSLIVQSIINDLLHNCESWDRETYKIVVDEIIQDLKNYGMKEGSLMMGWGTFSLLQLVGRFTYNI
jgi:hypothetical protein